MSSELERFLTDKLATLPPDHPDLILLTQVLNATRTYSADAEFGYRGDIIYERRRTQGRTLEELAVLANQVGQDLPSVALVVDLVNYQSADATTYPYPLWKAFMERLLPNERSSITSPLNQIVRWHPKKPSIQLQTVGDLRNAGLRELTQITNVGLRGAQFIQAAFAPRSQRR